MPPINQRTWYAWLATIWLSAQIVMAQGPFGVVSGDFDGDGVVGMADLLQFREALGGNDLRFDLDEDGQVDIDDFFHLAQLFDATPLRPDPPPLPYQISETSEELGLTFEKFAVTLGYGGPFGITSLRLIDQPGDFAHKDLPVADWEWFWQQTSGGRRSIKLIQPRWNPPEIETTPDHVMVRFRRANVFRRGVDLSVEYWFFPQRAAFHVTYRIDNGSQTAITDPYIMVGFPGFTNQDLITRVSTSQERRSARWGNFGAEAIADGRADYILLREKASHVREAMQSSVEMHTDAGHYELRTYFVAKPAIRQVSTAHTNKPAYLTSHLYATLTDLPAGGSHHLLIYYILRGPQSP
jgi:hypothetical protein